MDMDANPKLKAILNSKAREARVTRQLLLSQVILMKISPGILEKLTNLRHLYIVGCSLTGSVPHQLVNMSNLQTLDLSDNKLNVVPSPIFENLRQLRTVDLSRNDFVAFPKSLKYLQKLKKLNLSFNKFLEMPAELGYLKHLQHLDMSSNLIDSISTDAICQAWKNSLMVLKLANNLISRLPSQIGLLTALQELDIRNNRLRYLPATAALLLNISIFCYSGNEWRVYSPHSSYSLYGQHLEEDDVQADAASYGPAALEKLLSYCINSNADEI
ncbi:uncharacterized protein TRIADDRAFT_62316 [Trichoplax adhaerens]|uniref:Disease resistance R13L4/SHOC-2-like LRR domain-containing protein n=1 Tax=Trichoplax adhaerens TaxID=10228 RepID=B3SDG0_TRIAD|nr:hypothetical protein TRIADDRAFT_62316 [Trichoplax adhaerens]EDV19225.1 hypothetical protein TRIADDRAFT_62316 [Trichoplax adhaerens]|eukprot:XP_002118291.1 hypothetical protein TRIADDRAFT_62316 [Trichoplax adhaerens]